MNDALLRHLGVALLGHWNMERRHIPHSMLPTFLSYASDSRLLPDLLRRPSLRAYVIEQEFTLPDNTVGRASLAAVAILIGALPFEKDPSVITEPSKQDVLFNRIRTRVRIRRFQGRF